MGYYVWLGRDGAWRLEVNLPQDSVNKGATKVLASGTVAGFDPDVWHRVKLDFDGDAITAVLDGHDLATVHDATYAAGQTGSPSTRGPGRRSRTTRRRRTPDGHRPARGRPFSGRAAVRSQGVVTAGKGG